MASLVVATSTSARKSFTSRPEARVVEAKSPEAIVEFVNPASSRSRRLGVTGGASGDGPQWSRSRLIRG